MFLRISFWLVLIVLVSCVQHKEDDEDLVEVDSYDVEIEYAEGFEVYQSEGEIQVITHSIGENEAFADTLNILHKYHKEEDRYLATIFSKVATQSSTHLAFIDVLGLLNRVKGHCGMQYISNQNVIEELKKNGTIEVCTGDATNFEPLLEINPELYLIYPFENSESDEFERKGINTFFIAEYLETTPLARLEWIKLFGMIFNRYEKAELYFNSKKEAYLSNKIEQPDTSKKFILNLPYEDAWFMPSSQSFVVNLIEDAGLSYYYDDQSKTENFLRSTEEVWEDGIEAEYWIIIASRPEGFTLGDLISEVPVYKEFKSVKEGKVIFCNTGVNDYFSNGVVEPHIMLQDILFATGQLQDYSPKYFKILR